MFSISICCWARSSSASSQMKVALAGRGEVLEVAIDHGAVGVGGNRPETGPVGFVVPPHRGVVPEEGEPLVGYAVGEGLRIGEVDVVEADVAQVDLGL